MKKGLLFVGGMLSVSLVTSCVGDKANSKASVDAKTSWPQAKEGSAVYVAGSDEYKVSQELAEEILAELKKNADSPRPPLNTIATFNGGTAEKESNDPDAPCLADEQQFFQEIQSGLLNEWRNSWLNGDSESFVDLLASSEIQNGIFPTNFKFSPIPVSKNIARYPWKDSIKGSVKDYLGNFSKIEDFDLVTFKVTSPRMFRDKKLNMVKAQLQVHFDLRGIEQSGSRRHDRGLAGITVEKKGSAWKVSKIENWGIETLVSKKPTFKEVTKISNVDRIPQYQRLEAIRRGGYAIAVGDYNNDGIKDFYVGAHGPGKLLRGLSDGTFEEVKDSGLNNDTLVKTAVFADFDNDGKTDLLVVRFSGQSRIEKLDLRTDVVLYKNTDGASFKRVGKIIGEKPEISTAMPAAVGDFNNDGLLDFYIGYPGNKDFTVHGKIVGREAVKEQGVYINQGNFNFVTKDKMVDHSTTVSDKFTRHQQIFPHSSVAFDFDQDGDVDIVVIDDRGNISPAYQNDGNGKFIQAERHIGMMNKGFGMGLATTDIDNDGIIDMVLTNVNFNSKYRIDSSCRANWDDEIFNNFDHGLKLYKGLKKGSFAEATGTLGLDFAGEGLAGVEFFDYDNDGYQDLYVANGLWSGTDRDEDLSSIFARSYLGGTEAVIKTHRGIRPQSEVMDILSGFSGSIIGKDKKSRLSLAGFQRNRLFRNNGDGSFTEVGYLEGVDSIADGYVIARSDYDKDGDLDLILRNGDPGTGDVSFEPVQVFQNLNGGKSLRLKLVGSKSNRDAIGAEVLVKTNDTQQTQQLIANNGTAQSELDLHFGLGNADTAQVVEIKWPSGKKSIIKDMKAGYHVINESKSKGFAVTKK